MRRDTRAGGERTGGGGGRREGELCRVQVSIHMVGQLVGGSVFGSQ